MLDDWWEGGGRGVQAVTVSKPYEITPQMVSISLLTSFRYKQTRHGTFFEVQNGGISISPPVSRQFKTLRHRIAVLDPPLPKVLGQLVDIIESCFEIDEWKRPSAAMIVSQMRAAHAILAADQEFNGQGGDDPGVVEIA